MCVFGKVFECLDSGKLELTLTTNTKTTYRDPNYCVLKPNHPCPVFLDVYSVLCLSYLTSCICVCHLSHGPFVGVPTSQALPYYCTSTCARSCCTWRASCVNSKPKKIAIPKWPWQPARARITYKKILHCRSVRFSKP